MNQIMADWLKGWYKAFLKNNAEYEVRYGQVWRVGGIPSSDDTIPYKVNRTWNERLLPYIINKK